MIARVIRGREPRTHRLTIRIPASLYKGLRTAAKADERSVNDWAVVQLEEAVKQRLEFSVRAREALTKRLTLRLPEPLHEALLPLAKKDKRDTAPWIVNALQEMVSRRLSQTPSPAE